MVEQFDAGATGGGGTQETDGTTSDDSDSTSDTSDTTTTSTRELDPTRFGGNTSTGGDTGGDAADELSDDTATVEEPDSADPTTPIPDRADDSQQQSPGSDPVREAPTDEEAMFPAARPGRTPEESRAPGDAGQRRAPGDRQEVTGEPLGERPDQQRRVVSGTGPAQEQREFGGAPLDVSGGEPAQEPQEPQERDSVSTAVLTGEQRREFAEAGDTTAQEQETEQRDSAAAAAIGATPLGALLYGTATSGRDVPTTADASDIRLTDPISDPMGSLAAARRGVTLTERGFTEREAEQAVRETSRSAVTTFTDPVQEYLEGTEATQFSVGGARGRRPTGGPVTAPGPFGAGGLAGRARQLPGLIRSGATLSGSGTRVTATGSDVARAVGRQGQFIAEGTEGLVRNAAIAASGYALNEGFRPEEIEAPESREEISNQEIEAPERRGEFSDQEIEAPERREEFTDQEIEAPGRREEFSDQEIEAPAQPDTDVDPRQIQLGQLGRQRPVSEEEGEEEDDDVIGVPPNQSPTDEELLRRDEANEFQNVNPADRARTDRELIDQPASEAGAGREVGTDVGGQADELREEAEKTFLERGRETITGTDEELLRIQEETSIEQSRIQESLREEQLEQIEQSEIQNITPTTFETGEESRVDTDTDTDATDQTGDLDQVNDGTEVGIGDLIGSSIETGAGTTPFGETRGGEDTAGDEEVAEPTGDQTTDETIPELVPRTGQPNIIETGTPTETGRPEETATPTETGNPFRFETPTTGGGGPGTGPGAGIPGVTIPLSDDSEEEETRQFEGVSAGFQVTFLDPLTGEELEDGD